jgi:hypothetical protein
MADEKKQPPAPGPAPSPAAPSHIVVTDDVGRYRKGQVLPYAPELVKELQGNFRPATDFDLGVAGIMTR